MIFDGGCISLFTDDYSFLSNFSYSPISFDGNCFPTAEHAYQWMKTDDIDWKIQIATADSPGKAKRLGRKCPMRSDWEEVKDNVMESMLRLKFNDELLMYRLKRTGTKTLNRRK